MENNKRLKIGIFMDSFYPDINGVVLVIDNLTRCFKEYADVTLVVPKTGSEDEDKNRPYKVIRIDSISVPTTDYKLGISDIEPAKINKIFKDVEFDIIHIHSPFSVGRLGVKLARERNIPVIATMHTRFDFEFKKYLKSNILSDLGIKHIIKTFNNCDICIALNESLVKVYKDYGYKKEPVIIHNGTDLRIVDDKQKALDTVNKLYNIDENETVFLFVGRITSIKNIFFILDVLKKLKENNISYKMLYVGSGPDEENLKKKIKEYGMENEVIMTGKITDRELLKSIYYRAKLFIFPSLFDASSLVQIEAASQETPTIFIENSVTSNTVVNNKNGFTAPNDVDAFTNRIVEILNDDKLYNEVKTNAYKDLATPWEDIASQTYQLYLKEIDKKIGE